MEREYKVTLYGIWRTSRFALIWSVFVFVYFYIGVSYEEARISLMLVSWPIFLGIIIPFLILLLNYLSYNLGKSLKIDLGAGSYKVNKWGNEEEFFEKDIEIVEVIKGIFHKTEIDHLSRWQTSWSRFGYIRIILRDKRKFVFTSLMIDFTPMPTRTNRLNYKFFPLLFVGENFN